MENLGILFELPRSLRRLFCCGLFFVSFQALATEDQSLEAPSIDQHVPCADRNPRRNVYFGDLHVHTGLSLDASTQGTKTRPAEAYRFAKGERIGLQPFDEAGKPLRSAQLSAPLDFSAVTDHAELIGEWNICNSPDLRGYDSLVCRVYRRWPRVAFFYMNWKASTAKRHDFCGPDGSICLDAAREPWKEIREAANAASDPSSACSFTGLIGYEWTGTIGAPGNNFHRNVIFRNSHVPELPISYIDSPVLTDFWARLKRECPESGTGCDAIVIPHNSNLSAGLMFRTVQEDGSPITREEANARTEFETLVEIMQHKGESECAIGLDTTDELCNFEKLTMNNFSGRFLRFEAQPPVAHQFIRNVLKEGLQLEQTLGVNPFRFGIIASTDTHLGTPGLVAESAKYPGHGGAGNPNAGKLVPGFPDALDFNPGGLAALWAEENTRDALFRAMKRKEAYGTSGPRIRLRFFGGWDYPKKMCESDTFVETGYAQGVPMGGDLPLPPKTRTSSDSSTKGPTFAFSALRDPGDSGAPGTPLQRVQIIKGWVDGDSLNERVFEVAGDPANGASVDLDTCEPSGAGFDSLCGVWTDPTFDPTQHAFYYARVVENPTCRWSQKLCVSVGVHCDDPSSMKPGFEACCSEEHTPVIQERAWSSPIWFRPAEPKVASSPHRTDR